jgi:solute carrier family 44 (choline transporter-like protein), member 2/4/5
LGTLAFGSLLIAILDSIRLILAYIDRQQKELAGKEGNNLVSCLLKCCICCVACFECFVKYINKNAYIYVFLNCENFITSSKNALSSVFSNPATMGLVAGFG